MATPWPVGTDTGDALRKGLQAYLKAWLSNAKYKGRLPKQFLHVLLPGEAEHSGIVIRVVTEADPKPPWTYELGSRDIAEDYHQIALFVKADKKLGGATSVSKVFGAVRALFASRDGTPERDDLIARGICMCFETPDGLVVDPEGNDAEGTVFRQQINLRCNTDTFLN